LQVSRSLFGFRGTPRDQSSVLVDPNRTGLIWAAREQQARSGRDEFDKQAAHS